jgi:hypothetical protein
MGSLDEILILINSDKENIISIDIKEKEALTAYDLTKETQYMAKIIYKRSDYNERKI